MSQLRSHHARAAHLRAGHGVTRVASKQALPHRLAWGTWPAQSHSNLTYTNAGGISEYTCFSHRWSGVPVRAPAGRPTEAPNHLPYEVAQRRDLHEHVTHAASGECSSARAVGSRLQQARSFFPTAGAAAAVIVAAAGGAPSGLRRSGRSWRRGGATLRQHLRRRELLRPGRRSRSGCGAPPATRWAALRTPGRVSAGRRWGAPHVALLHDLGPSRSLRSTSPPGSGLLAPLARVGLRCSAAGRERHKDARRPAARHSEWQAEQAPLCLLPNLVLQGEKSLQAEIRL